jgi:predicted ATP-dependent serine protease
MAYYCRDCSYRGKSSGQGGKCLACESYNIQYLKVEVEEKPRSKVYMVILVSLWTYLVALILWKLMH